MLKKIKKIFELEAITGVLLIIASAVSVMIANSENKQIFGDFFKIIIPLKINFLEISKNLTISDWINEFLMSIFFLLVGLELKQEFIDGELSTPKKFSLPLICAIGGVIFPALIFYFFNRQDPQNIKAIAVPTATDIAFAYAVICLFGNAVPKSLKVFLISLAIFDDLFAVLMIAFFYTAHLDLFYLWQSGLVLLVLIILNIKKITLIESYLLLGLILWLMILKSGIHPTVAGVLLALTIPQTKHCLEKIIKIIAPQVNYLILPLFAFANSAIVINSFSSEFFLKPVFNGVFFGLFLGKQIGIMFFASIAVALKIASLPEKSSQKTVSWFEFYGVSILCGIGFTMSLFIMNLVFFDSNMIEEVKFAILLASICSTVIGCFIILLNICLRLLKTNNQNF